MEPTFDSERPTKRHLATSAGLVALAVALSLHGGTPAFHPDSLTETATRTLIQQGRPQFFNYPGLLIYLHAAALWISEPFGGRNVMGNLPGHLITAAFSALGALATYGIAFRFTGRRLVSFLAGAGLVLSPLWNADAHFLTVDIPVSALSATTIYLLLRFMAGEQPFGSREVLVLGVACGLTTSAKYNGALVGVACSLAILFHGGPPARAARLWVRWLNASFLTFFVTNPTILLDYQLFLRDLAWEFDHSAVGHFGYMSGPPGRLLGVAATGWGTFGLALSAIGALVLVAGRASEPFGRDAKVQLVLWAFPVLHLLVLATTRLGFQRYLLPLMPLLAALAAVAAEAVGGLIATHMASNRAVLMRRLCAVLLVVAIGQNLPVVLRHNHLLAQADTRQLLAAGLEETWFGDRDLVVGATAFTLAFLDSFEKSHHLRAVDAPDLVVLDSFTHDRYLYDFRYDFDFDFGRLERGAVVIVSPFRLQKAEVPFSPKSAYSPYPPDLWHRERPGPYLEIYATDAELARLLSVTLQSHGSPSELRRPSEGYYHSLLAGRVLEHEQPR